MKVWVFYFWLRLYLKVCLYKETNSKLLIKMFGVMYIAVGIITPLQGQEEGGAHHSKDKDSWKVGLYPAASTRMRKQ